MLISFAVTCIYGNIYVLMEKNEKSPSLKPLKPAAFMFGMWQWLMVGYIDCVIHAPGVKFGNTPGDYSLHTLTI